MVPAVAQGIYEANLATENSIVRVWPSNDREVIIYNETSSGNGGFLLYTIGSSIAKHIDLPKGISVRDFEIMGDEVWFCGEYNDPNFSSGSCGAVGTFNIPNTFTGNNVINYRTLTTAVGVQGDNVFVTSLARLDLFWYGGFTVMAMVGDSYIYDELTMPRSTVVSAFFSPGGLGSGWWTVCALLDKDSTALFTDIAALDNVVTAVGTAVDGTKLKAKTFYKDLFFPNHPVVSHFGDSIACFDPIGKALIIHTIYDEAAVVQLDVKAYTLLHIFDFASGNAIPTFMTRITDDPQSIYAAPWDMQEVRYNLTSDTINVLEYGVLPGGSTFETLLWTFPRAISSTLEPVQPMTLVTQASMDVAIDGHPVTVGEVQSSGLLDIHSFSPGLPYINPNDPTPIVAPTEPLLELDACTDYAEIPNNEEEPIVHQIIIDDNGPTWYFDNNEYNPELTEIEFNQICE